MKPHRHLASSGLLLMLLVPGQARAAVSIERVTASVTTTDDDSLLGVGTLRAVIASVLAALGAR